MWIVKENYVVGTVNDLANKLGLSSFKTSSYRTQ